MKKAFFFHKYGLIIISVISILGILISAHNSAIAQVINDNIENRKELILNHPISSNTIDCTLQWSCLDHIQTKKCIQYHNDQWFFFKSSDTERKFINISGQQCRDLRGVQLLVIDGPPCKPEEFKILKCVSLGTQDDIFITLDGLESRKEYLVLVDGYLHDFCEFKIEFSHAPKGLPITDDGRVPIEMKLAENYHLDIFWSVPDSIASSVEKYEVYRRHDTAYKALKIHEVLQGYGTHNFIRNNYTVEEILPDYGVYHYKIIGVGDGERILISKSLIEIPKPKTKGMESSDWVELDLHYPKPCKLRISIYDAKNHSLLYWTNFSYDDENRLFEHYVKSYKDAGVWQYRIEVVNLDTNEKKSYSIKK